jgi:hypothetical protein
LSSEAEQKTKVDIDVDKAWRRPIFQSILFCDFANQTIDGKVNLIGVFDRLYVHPSRKITAPFFLFVRTAGTLTGPIQVRCIGPDRGLVFTIDYAATGEFELKNDLPAYVQFVGPVRFAVNEQGIYWFDVSFEGGLLGGVPLMIEFRETEDKESGTDTYP